MRDLGRTAIFVSVSLLALATEGAAARTPAGARSKTAASAVYGAWTTSLADCSRLFVQPVEGFPSGSQSTNSLKRQSSGRDKLSARRVRVAF